MLCRDIAERNGLRVVEVFSDAAISGAKNDRPGFLRTLDAAKARRFDVLICEDQDRLTRDQGDLHATCRVLDFSGVRLLSSSGYAGKIARSVRGLLNEMYLENLAVHVRRGLADVVSKGLHAGGRAYGYRAVPGNAGELHIVEDEAKVVREIFEAYASGKTPRQIAGDLNRRGVKPPRGGRRWNASTLNGSAGRNTASCATRSIAASSSGTGSR